MYIKIFKVIDERGYAEEVLYDTVRRKYILEYSTMDTEVNYCKYCGTHDCDKSCNELDYEEFTEKEAKKFILDWEQARCNASIKKYIRI